MSEILNRNWVHPSLHIKKTTTGIHKLRFFQIIDYWKETFLQHHVKPGQTIGIALSHMDELYLASIFASLEYRLKIVIILKPYSMSDTKNPKFNAYFPLDVLILDTKDNIEPLVYNHFLNNAKIVIHRDYDFKLPKKISKKVQLITPEPDDVCLMCASSGSTGEPKLISHTHKFFYELCNKNWEPLGFEESDYVLHLSTFNHGSALGIYFLPSIKKCRVHYFHIEGFDPTVDTDENWDLWIQFCQKYKITKTQSVFSGQTDNMIAAIERSKEGLPNLTIMVLSFINPKWHNIIKEGKLKKIISIFGCSETSGPLFLPYVDKDTKEFDPNFLGKPIEGFYKTYTDSNGELTIDVPIYNKIVKTEDFLEKTEKGYKFISKKKMYRINDIDINVYDIQKIFEEIIVDKYRGPSAKDIIIIVDEIYNKLYIVSDRNHFSMFIEEISNTMRDRYNNKIKINGFFFIENLNQFVTGIKIDKEKLLNYIRQIKNEQY